MERTLIAHNESGSRDKAFREKAELDVTFVRLLISLDRRVDRDREVLTCTIKCLHD